MGKIMYLIRVIKEIFSLRRHIKEKPEQKEVLIIYHANI